MEYNPNSAYNPVPVLTPDEQAHKKDAVTAMVCGIIGLVLSWTGAIAIAGLILSIIGFVRAKKNRAFAKSCNIKENGMNTAGYICGLIGLIISAVAIVVGLAAFVLLVVFGLSMVTTVLPEIVDQVPEIIESIPAAGAAVGMFLF